MQVENKKFDFIDSLRGYAILGVVIRHTLMGEKNILFSSILNFGVKGVQLFYIVSAFTLLLSYNNRKTEANPYLNFFIRRFFRIAPMFYMAIVFYYFIGHEIGGNEMISIYNIISHFLFIHGFSPYWENTLVPGGWSVAVEVLFYLICPFLFRMITSEKKAITYYFITLIIGQILIFYFQKNQLIEDKVIWDGYLYYYFPTQMPVFFLGFLVYFLVNKSLKDWLTFLGMSIFSLVLFYVVQIIFKVKFDMLNNMLAGIALSVFVLLLSKNKLPILVNPILSFLGKISFSLYLIHFAVIDLLVKYKIEHLFVNPSLNYVYRFTVVLTVSSAISFMFYKVIELPFQKIGKQIIKKLELKELN